jgi:hypothetical protein
MAYKKDLISAAKTTAKKRGFFPLQLHSEKSINSNNYFPTIFAPPVLVLLPLKSVMAK